MIPTTHYSIQKPEGSDEFQTSLFGSNYDIIDGAIYDALTAAQNAQTTANSALAATGSGSGGTGGATDADRTFVYSGYTAPKQLLSSRTSATYSYLTIPNLPRGGVLMSIATVDMYFFANQTQEVTLTGMIDGTAALYGTNPHIVRAAGNVGDFYKWQFTVISTRTATPGAHSCSMKCSIGTGSPQAQIYQIRALAFVAAPGT